MTAMRIMCLLAIAVGVSACSVFLGDGETVEIQSEHGDSTTETRRVRVQTTLSTGEDRRDFTVEVSPFEAIAEQALVSGRYKATVHCLRTYGGSEIAWTVGPDQPIEELPVQDDTVTLQGRCLER